MSELSTTMSHHDRVTVSDCVVRELMKRDDSLPQRTSDRVGGVVVRVPNRIGLIGGTIRAGDVGVGLRLHQISPVLITNEGLVSGSIHYAVGDFFVAANSFEATEALALSTIVWEHLS